MAQDGTISISIEVDGKQVEVASKELDNLGKSGQDSGKGVKGAEDAVKGVGNESEKAGMSIGKVATALGLVAIASVAFKVLRDSVGEAVARFDTLERFPKVLQSLGVSAADSERAMTNLSNGIDGLPTKLDDIASTAQRMYTSFGDMDKATDSALALNNALLGSGASVDQAKRGTEQYLKSLQTGKMYLSTWNTLQETMDTGLVKIAESFGMTKDELYDALKSGAISMDDFNDKMIELGTGTGIMAKLARENSEGIGNSFSNLSYAAAIGIANVIKSIDNLSKEVTGSTIAQNIDKMKGVIRMAFAGIVIAIEMTTPAFKLMATVISALLPTLSALTPVLIGMATAFAIHAVIKATTDALKSSETVTLAVTAAKKLYTLATDGAARAELLSAVSSKVLTVARSAMIGITTAMTVAELLLTGQITLAAAAKYIAATAATVLGGAIQFMLGPIGWVTLAIGALVGAIIGIVMWFNKATEDGERLAAENEALSESTNALTDSVKSNSDSYKDGLETIEASAQANKQYAEEIEALAEKENKSAAEKQLLKDKVDLLNESVEGLGLSYNEEADALSMSSEQIEGRIGLLEEQTSYNDALERQKEIIKEQHEVDSKLESINDLRKEYNQNFEDGTIKTKEFKDGIAELDEQEGELTTTKALLGEQQKVTEDQITTSMDAIAESTEASVDAQKRSFESLDDAHKEIVISMNETWQDYKDSATDMFDTLSDEVTTTIEEMGSNLEENQRIVGEWGDNIAELAARGVDDGLLETLRAAGPESAGHVNALVNASDKELEELSTAFKAGGDVATEALAQSLGIEGSGVLEAVGHLVSDTEATLKEQVNSADFQSIGGDVTDGLAEGIDNGSKTAEDASKNMAKNTTDATKDAFQTKSPSKVYKGIGGDLTDGLALGINDGTTKVTQAIQKMFKSVQDSSDKAFKNIVKSHGDSVREIETSLNKLPEVTQKAMESTINRLKTGADSQVKVMDNLATNLDNSFKEIVKNYDSSTKEIEKTFDKLIEITARSMKNMLDRLKDGAKSNVQVMRSLAKDLLSPFNSTPSEFQVIGTDAMAGFNRGLKSGEAQVMATARGIANNVASTMRKALDTHSPSRVTQKIGEDTGQGLADGIKNKKKTVDAITERLVNSIIKITNAMNAEISTSTKGANAEIKKIEGRSQEDIKLIHSKARKAKRKLTQAEVVRIRRIEEDSAKKVINIESKLSEDVLKIKEKHQKDIDAANKKEFDSSKNWIDKKLKANELSLAEELQAWERVQARYATGTKEREDAEEGIYKVKQEIHNKLTSLNDEYLKNVKELNQKLIDEENKLNAECTKALDDRTKSLSSFVGIFDEIKEASDVSGQDLINNLKGQVNTFGEWSKNIKDLAERGIDEGLLGELRDMGPKAAAEIAALNGLTDDQLTEYADLWKEKNVLAREQATEELEDMKKDTSQKIDELHKQTESQLDKLTKEWQTKVKQIRIGTKDEFNVMKSDLKTIGEDSMQGMINGLESMRGPLMATARSIANAVKSTMASALDINSPSGVMRDDIGRWIPEGIALGIRDNAASVYNELGKLSKGMMITSTPEQALGTSRMAYSSNGIAGGGASTTNHNDKSRKMDNQITIKTYDSGAKEMERTLRRLQFGF